MTQEVKIGARVTMAGVVTEYNGFSWLIQLDKGKGSINSILYAESFLTVENPVEPLKIGDTVFVLDTESSDPVEIISICDGLAWLRCKDGDFLTFALKNLKRI